MRPSNTEPIVRIFTEAKQKKEPKRSQNCKASMSGQDIVILGADGMLGHDLTHALRVKGHHTHTLDKPQ